MICHGNGDLARDGCCYVAGRVCPLRWKILDGRVYDHTGADIGSVAEVAASVGANKGQARAIENAVQGRTFACSVAARIIGADPKILDDPDALADAWDNDPDYVAQVRPTWADIEANLGLPEGAYNCSTWRGVNGPQCCFAETPEENSRKAQGLAAQEGMIGADQD